MMSNFRQYIVGLTEVNLQMSHYFNRYSEVYLKHIGMGSVISELYNNSAILLRNYRKMTILWSFSYNSLVKFHGKKIWDP